MSEFSVDVVRIGELEKHPNADSLSIVQVYGGYPVIVRTSEWTAGELAVYVPINALVPLEDPRFSFLKSNRIKAAKLRGVFSMGLLVKPDDGMVEGQNVQAELKIERWLHPSELAEETNCGTPGLDRHLRARAKKNYADDEQLPADVSAPPIYDLEGFRKYGRAVLVEGEQVRITEKIHGENFRAFYHDSRLWVGSRTRFKKQGTAGRWWTAAEDAELLAKLDGDAFTHDDKYVFYGESYGYTGGFPYDTTPERPARLRIFDVFDMRTGTWLDAHARDAVCKDLGLDQVPELYRGPWNESLTDLCNGQSTLNDSHIREGCVIRPEKERWDHKCGRVVLKLVSEAYLLKAAA